MIDLQRDLVGDVRDYLRMLLGAVAFVLLVAAVNLASASLARGTARGREMAIRLALGSGRGRLVRQLLTESTMLAVAGGVAGVGVAAWLVRVLVRLAPASVPRPATIGLDVTVLGFAVAVSVLTGLLIGLAPALFSSDIAPGDRALGRSRRRRGCKEFAATCAGGRGSRACARAVGGRWAAAAELREARERTSGVRHARSARRRSGVCRRAATRLVPRGG